MALRNLLVRVGADTSGLTRGLRDAQDKVKYFGSSVTGSLKGLKGQIAGALAGLSGGFVVAQAAQDAMRYEALMTTLGESMGDSRKDFEKWAETAGNSFGFSRLQAANLANTLSLNFKKIAVDQKDLVDKTTKMMEVAGVIANKRGMRMEEVSDRIRSAMNQEADGADELGVNVRIAAVQQSKAYKEMADGTPWDKLNENVRKTILYEHILEQVTSNLGSTLQDTTQARMAVFTASLADARMALGQAFLPIIYTVLPYLTAFMQGLYKAMQYVAAFTRALFGGFKYQGKANSATNAAVAATDKQAESVGALGDAQEKAGKKTKKAAKEAKRGVAAFDQVNQLAESGGAGAGAGAGAGGAGGGVGEALPALPSPDMSGFEEGINNTVEYFKKKLAPIKEFFAKIWTEITEFFMDKTRRIRNFWWENGDQIIQAMKNVAGFLAPIIGGIVKFIWESIKGLISGIIKFFTGLLKFFAGVFTGDWSKAWEGLKDMVIGAFQAIWNFFNLTFVGGIKKALAEIVTNGAKAFFNFAKNFQDEFWKAIAKVTSNVKGFVTGLITMFKDMGRWWTDYAVSVAVSVVNAFSKIGSVGNTIWNAIKAAFSGTVRWFLTTIINPVIDSFGSIKSAFRGGIESGLRAVINNIRNPLNSMIDTMNNVKNNIPVANRLPNIPRIPYLAKGGIATGATLAMVGEGSQDEAIAPLDKLQGFITTAVLTAMRAQGTGGGTTGGDIILNIDGRQFARIVKPHLDKEMQRIGSNVRLNPI